MIELLLLHALDGRDYYINPLHVVSVTEALPAGDPKKSITARANCVIHMSDGKYLTVEEACSHIRERLGNRQ